MAQFNIEMQGEAFEQARLIDETTAVQEITGLEVIFSDLIDESHGVVTKLYFSWEVRLDYLGDGEWQAADIRSRGNSIFSIHNQQWDEMGDAGGPSNVVVALACAAIAAFYDQRKGSDPESIAQQTWAPVSDDTLNEMRRERMTESLESLREQLKATEQRMGY